MREGEGGRCGRHSNTCMHDVIDYMVRYDE